jgi:hypothetical protein
MPLGSDQRAREGETWDRAARATTRFRLDHDVIDHDLPLGPEPPGSNDDLREWDQANSALERAQRQLGRESTPGAGRSGWVPCRSGRLCLPCGS